MNEYEEQLTALKEAYLTEKQKREAYEQQYYQTSRFSGAGSDDLIRFQLELDNILERVEHLLRGDVLEFDSRGNLTWKEPSNKEHILFNEYGVQEILRILSVYVNRNTILSNYDETEIKLKVYDFGMELTDLIFMKYNKMFYLPDPPDPDDKEASENYYDLADEKCKLYPMIVREIVDVVHSTYLRALNGGERHSLREARHVSQSINPQPSALPGTPQQKRNFSLFKPSTWVKN